MSFIVILFPHVPHLYLAAQVPDNNHVSVVDNLRQIHPYGRGNLLGRDARQMIQSLDSLQESRLARVIEADDEDVHLRLRENVLPQPAQQGELQPIGHEHKGLDSE